MNKLFLTPLSLIVAGKCHSAILLAVMLLLGAGTLSEAHAQHSLTSGGLHNGAITADGSETWTFTAGAGDTVLLRATQVSGGTGFSPRMMVYDSSGKLVGWAASSESITSSARLDLMPRTDGAFTLRIDSGIADGAGAYRINFLRLPGAFIIPDGDTGGPLTNGGRHEGSLPVGDLDTWTFEADAGEVVRLRVAQLSGGTRFTPRIRVFDSEGLLVATGTGTSGSETSEMRTVFIPEAADTFTVVLDASAAEETGAYRLHYLKLPGEVVVPAGDHGEPMVNGGRHEGSISIGDMDPWTFEADEGDLIMLRAAQLSGGAGFAPRLRVYDASGILVAHAADDTTVSATEARVDFLVPGTGVFTMVVDSSLIEGSGGYRLHFLKLPGDYVIPPGDDGAPLVSGENHDGGTTLGDLDVWTFEAAAGDRVTLELSKISGGDSFTPLARVYSAGGLLVGRTTGSMSVILASGGSYHVVVDSSGTGGTGAYRLHYVLEGGPFSYPPATGSPLTNGGNHEGAIDLDEEDRWTFEAEAGEQVLLRLGRLTASAGTSSHTLRLRVYGPDGEPLGDVAAFSDPAFNFTADIAGTYTAVVSFTTGITGTYRLHYLKVPSEFIVPPGDEGGALIPDMAHDGVITMGDLDVWTFEAHPGYSIGVRMERVTGSSFSPLLRVFGPTGQLIGSHSHSTLAQVDFMPADAGIYVVVAANNTSGGTGTYQIWATGLPPQDVAPRLALIEPGTLVVNWPSSMLRAGYVLQHNETLDPATWEDVIDSLDDYLWDYVDNGLNVRLLVPLEEQRFFRLRPTQ